jgi:hypothetical protein
MDCDQQVESNPMKRIKKTKLKDSLLKKKPIYDPSILNIENNNPNFKNFQNDSLRREEF